MRDAALPRTTSPFPKRLINQRLRPIATRFPSVQNLVPKVENHGAQTLYRRLGFREIAGHGVHWDME
jgi:hypothetical protein